MLELENVPMIYTFRGKRVRDLTDRELEQAQWCLVEQLDTCLAILGAGQYFQASQDVMAEARRRHRAELP